MTRKVATLLLAFLAISSMASAQETSLSLKRIAKQVVFDPTTYAVAGLNWFSSYKDWETSRPLFDRGFHEANPLFTVSGQPNDIPVSHGEGNRRITIAAIQWLGYSATVNTVVRTGENILRERYPEHRRLIKVAGWTTRIAINGYLAKTASEQHFGQWQRNNDMLRAIK